MIGSSPGKCRCRLRSAPGTGRLHPKGVIELVKKREVPTAATGLASAKRYEVFACLADALWQRQDSDCVVGVEKHATYFGFVHGFISSFQRQGGRREPGMERTVGSQATQEA